MRIAFLSVSAEMGGSEASLFELVRGIRRLRPAWEPVVFVPRDGRLPERVRAAGAEARVLPMPEALAKFGESTGKARLARRGAALVAAAGALRAYAAELNRAVSSCSPDVVHSNGFKLHVLASRALAADLPLVWHMHEYLSSRSLTRTLLKRLRMRPQRIVANSRSVAADLAMSLRSDRIETIYNAVDLAEFTPEGPVTDLDALAGLPPAVPGTLRVGLVATFGRWKGHETFMRAIQALGPDAPVRGYVVGGPLYDTAGSQHSLAELTDVARRCGVQDRMAFTGFVERPAAALRALDIVVHASTQPEPFGLVIAEGMACGRPVVVSAAGGAAEIVRDGVDAVTHAPGDVDSLRRALDRLIRDRDLRASLGRSARRSAEERFAPDVFAGAFVNLYERLQTAVAV